MNIFSTELIHLSYENPLSLAVADSFPELTFLILIKLCAFPASKDQILDTLFKIPVEIGLTRHCLALIHLPCGSSTWLSGIGTLCKALTENFLSIEFRYIHQVCFELILQLKLFYVHLQLLDSPRDLMSMSQ